MDSGHTWTIWTKLDKKDKMDKVDSMNKTGRKWTILTLLTNLKTQKINLRKRLQEIRNSHENIKSHFVNKTFDIRKSIISNWLSCTTPRKKKK